MESLLLRSLLSQQNEYDENDGNPRRIGGKLTLQNAWSVQQRRAEILDFQLLGSGLERNFPQGSPRPLPNERCSRQALFGCGFAAMVIVRLQLN